MEPKPPLSPALARDLRRLSPALARDLRRLSAALRPIPNLGTAPARNPGPIGTTPPWVTTTKRAFARTCHYLKAIPIPQRRAAILLLAAAALLATLAIPPWQTTIWLETRVSAAEYKTYTGTGGLARPARAARPARTTYRTAPAEPPSVSPTAFLPATTLAYAPLFPPPANATIATPILLLEWIAITLLAATALITLAGPFPRIQIRDPGARASCP